jgi:hypothetical protein
MTPYQKEFIELIGRIVHEYMSEDQQTQFDIDGKEMIGSLFIQGHKIKGDNLKNIPVLGISSSALDVFNATTGFGALVVSCIALYIEFKKKKKKPLKEQLERLEYLAALKESLRKHNMPPELVESIHKKYGEELIDILNEL